VFINPYQTHQRSKFLQPEQANANRRLSSLSQITGQGLLLDIESVRKVGQTNVVLGVSVVPGDGLPHINRDLFFSMRDGEVRTVQPERVAGAGQAA
jgi:hypothetical protein